MEFNVLLKTKKKQEDAGSDPDEFHTRVVLELNNNANIVKIINEYSVALPIVVQ